MNGFRLKCVLETTHYECVSLKLLPNAILWWAPDFLDIFTIFHHLGIGRWINEFLTRLDKSQ